MSEPTRQRYAMATGSMPSTEKSSKPGYSKGGKARGKPRMTPYKRGGKASKCSY